MDGIAVIYTNRKSLSLCIGANLSDFMKNKIKPYEMLEEFKAHPMVAALIKGVQPKEYMAHWIAEGGYDAMPELCGDGYLIAGDSAHALQCPPPGGIQYGHDIGPVCRGGYHGSFRKGDFSRTRPQRLCRQGSQDSYIMKDLKKYRRLRFRFVFDHHELFTLLPSIAGFAAREMLTVDGIPKKEKQRAIWKEIRKGILSLSRCCGSCGTDGGA